VSGNVTPYATLSPEVVLDAIAAAGYVPDGRLLALGSYENRVYQIGIEDGPALVAKFYRPERWSDVAIGEEHAFARELVEAELPIVAPIVVGARTLLVHDGFRYALYPRRTRAGARIGRSSRVDGPAARAPARRRRTRALSPSRRDRCDDVRARRGARGIAIAAFAVALGRRLSCPHGFARRPDRRAFRRDRAVRAHPPAR
jgi:hypothetical protein